MLCTLIGAIILSINIQVGLNMHLYDDIGDASPSLRGSTSSLEIIVNLLFFAPINFNISLALLKRGFFFFLQEFGCERYKLTEALFDPSFIKGCNSTMLGGF